MKNPITTACALLLGAACAAPAAGQAHVHGAARLDIAVEATRLTLQMESPLDSLLGFERAPRTDAERRQAQALVARLKAADTMFKIDPAAGCTLAGVELVSAALKLGDAPPGEEGHADLGASVEFHCTDATRAAYVDVGLFDLAPRLQRLEVQVATPQGQFKRDLARPARRIRLTR
jgi:hypothetical protein